MFCSETKNTAFPHLLNRFLSISGYGCFVDLARLWAKSTKHRFSFIPNSGYLIFRSIRLLRYDCKNAGKAHSPRPPPFGKGEKVKIGVNLPRKRGKITPFLLFSPPSLVGKGGPGRVRSAPQANKPQRRQQRAGSPPKQKCRQVNPQTTGKGAQKHCTPCSK